MKKKPALSAEDARIWRAYTQHVTPLHGPLEDEDLPNEDPCFFEQQMLPASAPSSHHSKEALPLLRRTPAKLPPLKMGEHTRIDGASARQLKRGQKAIEATLDLHGQRSEQAYETLMRTVENVRAKGGRVLLVITGKGRHESGVLRQLLPRWLEDAPLNAQVLAVQPARPMHGGGGAFYLLLKR